MTNAITIKSDATLNGQNAKDFFDFLTAQKKLGVSYFKQGSYPNFEGNTIFFKQDFLCEDAVDGSYTVDFVGKKLGKGSFGSVYHIDKVVQVTNVGFMPSGYTQPQVVKIQQHCRCIGSLKSHPGLKHNTITDVMNEFNISRKTSHLHPRLPVIESGSNISFSPMDEIPGCELYDIINDDLNKKTQLTLSQRMDLSVAVLQAVLMQVKRLGFIHRDLKPENFKVEMGPPIRVNIIDYGMAVEIPEWHLEVQQKRRCGTLSYMAPEVADPTGIYEHTSAIDVFSVGRVLGLIWGGLDESYNSKTSSAYRMYVNPEYLNNLTALFTSVPKEQLQEITSWKLDERIRHILKRMMDYNPVTRMNIESAFIRFRETQISLKQFQAIKGSATKPVAGGDPRFFAESAGGDLRFFAKSARDAAHPCEPSSLYLSRSL